MQRNRSHIAPWAIAAWLALWQIAAMALASPILLPSPIAVALRLVELLPEPAFWGRVAFSLARIAGGFALGAIFGVLGALASARWRAIKDLLAPFMVLAKSVPVASITVLALIWLRASNLAVLVVLLVVLPLVYENTLQGLCSTSRQLDEAAELLRILDLRRLRFLVMPQLFPYLRAALVTALGMGWKAGVAAEVIGIPAGSLGEALYDAKIYFDTAGLFAVTLATVGASAVTTWLVQVALTVLEPLASGAAGHAKQLESRAAGSPQVQMPAVRRNAGAAAEDGSLALRLDGISKSFGSKPVLDNVSFDVNAGTPACLMAPSGSGKTTLLRIIAGLEAPDAGCTLMTDEPKWLPRISMAFQDDRLADQASALANVRLSLAPESAAWNEAPALLEQLGLGERLLSAAGTCSGGERRRIALARALLTPHEVLLLDEPFTGLDGAARDACARIIRERERRSIVLVATHDREDAERLGARIIHISQ